MTSFKKFMRGQRHWKHISWKQMSSCDHSRVKRGHFRILKDAYLITYMNYKAMDVTFHTKGVSFKACEITGNSRNGVLSKTRRFKSILCLYWQRYKFLPVMFFIQNIIFS
jgi:hypothetical protein